MDLSSWLGAKRPAEAGSAVFLEWLGGARMAAEVHPARIEGVWHGMPSAPHQTAAFMCQALHFPTTSACLRAAIVSS